MPSLPIVIRAPRQTVCAPRLHQGDAIGAPATTTTAVTPLHQFEFATDAKAEGKQSALQAHSAIHAHQSQALTDRQLVEWDQARHSRDLMNDNDLQYRKSSRDVQYQ